MTPPPASPLPSPSQAERNDDVRAGADSASAGGSPAATAPLAPGARSMSLSSSSGGGGGGTGVSAASLGWLIDWEHRYGIATDPSPISLLPVPNAVPQPPSPPVSPPIEKREAIDDSTGDGDEQQLQQQVGSSSGPGTMDSQRNSGGNAHGSPAGAASFARPVMVRSETKGTMGTPADGSAAPPSERPGEADLMSEGPSLADQPLMAAVAAPAARRPLAAARAPPPPARPVQPPPSAPLPSQQPPAAVANASSDGGGVGGFLPPQRSNSGGRQPIPRWAAAAATAVQQQQQQQQQQPQSQRHHVKGSSLSSTLMSSSSLSSSSSSSSAASSAVARFKLAHSTSGGSARAFVPSGNALEDELSVAPGKEDAALPKQRRERADMNRGPGGPAPYPGGFPSLQVMARRLAEDNFDSLDSRELLAIDWEHRYGVESLAGPSSASPSPPTLYQHQQQQLPQLYDFSLFQPQEQQQEQHEQHEGQEEGNMAAAAPAAAAVPSVPAGDDTAVYLHAFPATDGNDQQPPPIPRLAPSSPPHSASAQHSSSMCGHCEEQPAAMACPSCGVAYCVECDTVLHRAVKLRSHARRRLAQPSMHMEIEEPPHPGPALDGWDGNGGSGAAAAEEEAMPEGPVPPTGSGEGGSGGWAAGAKASASSSSSSSGSRRGGGPHSGHLLVKAQHLEIDRHEIRILAKLGEGYFGVVFRGLWAGHSVAVKKLKHGTRRQVEEFRNEVRVLAQLRHPNITTFYGVTASPDWLIVTELLQGSLYRLLHSQSATLPRKLQMRIAKDIACGAAYIHGLAPSIVHRDINSSNVLLTGDIHALTRIVEEGRNEPVAKLSDFGLSRSVERFMTQCTGNAYYLAPEVFRGQHYTERADCYSYGILLWELFTRKYPFGQLNPRSAAFQQAEGLRPPIEGEDVPPPAVAIMTKAWEAHPEKRLPFRDIVKAWESVEQANAHGLPLPATVEELLALPPPPPSSLSASASQGGGGAAAPAGAGAVAAPSSNGNGTGNSGGRSPPLFPSAHSGGSGSGGYLMTPLEYRQKELDARLRRRPGLAAVVGKGLVQPAASTEREGRERPPSSSPLPQTFFGYDVSSRYLHPSAEGGGGGGGGELNGNALGFLAPPPPPPSQSQSAAVPAAARARALFPAVGSAPPAASSLSSHGGSGNGQRGKEAGGQGP